MKKIYLIMTFLSFLVVSFSQASCPKDLGDYLYAALKTTIAWVDINNAPNELTMTIRYYPCFSSRTEMDNLLTGVLKRVPNCRILNAGVHQQIDEYCILQDLRFV